MSPKAPAEPLIAVLGATGTGKSQLAVDIATRFNGEIINGDAMQMYRGLPVITNQIPLEERQCIPHHLLACRDFDQEPWRISHFKTECLRTIKEIRARGKVPVLVGGTHYYTQAVMFREAILDGSERDEVSEENRKMREGSGVDSSETVTSTPRSEDFSILDETPEVILQKLREVDPVMAGRWHPNETRKIRRSLEIYLQTGRPASEIYQEQQRLKNASNSLQPQDESLSGSPGAGQLRFPTLIFWVYTKDSELTRRLIRRVDNMAEQGLVAEAETLFNYLNEKKAQGIEVDRTRGIWVSMGFKELEPYFEALSTSSRVDGDAKTASEKQLAQLKEICLARIKTATRQYSRQQIKWIRCKLWTALSDAHAQRQLYVVDSTDVSAWDSAVRKPAEQVVEAFLTGGPEQCPDPKELSKTAREVFETHLQKALVVEERTVHRVRTCEVCNVTMQSDEQWETHVNGRRHKGAVKGAERRKARDEYFEACRREKSEADAADEGGSESE
ncbi:tRNA dimethylallyltransferase [Helicocarpus griseus UAMH5409]|uniref:tRNA dimethylallyltransferase n=1 Tax=Helicocarpus griseus UAMH5409 TaxID=1447875 RepID=A0A2B7XRQ1_9EURO|nr:tRNA dimethylallyltransferase [Helicocarpus griseus UAMH5409]